MGALLDYVGEVEKKYSLRPGILEHLIRAESAGNLDAVSKAGAIGLTQLLPATAKELGVDPHDPKQNIEGGARYLRQQLDRYGGSYAQALAGYNAGPNHPAVKRRDWDSLPEETRDYVGKFEGFLTPSPNPPNSGNSSFAGLSAEERGELASQRLGRPRPSTLKESAALPLERLPRIYRTEIDESLEQMGSRSIVDNVLGAVRYGASPVTSVVRGLVGEPVERVAEDLQVPEPYIDTLGALAEIATPGLGVTRLPGTASRVASRIRAAESDRVIDSLKALGPRPQADEAVDSLKVADSEGAAGGVIESYKAGGLKRTRALMESARALKVDLTPGRQAGGFKQTLEEQAAKLPGFDPVAKKVAESRESFHRALGREIGLDDLGDDPYITEDVLRLAKDKLSQAYDEILPHIQLKEGSVATHDLVKHAQKLALPFGKLEASTIPKSDLRKLAKITSGLDEQLEATGQISGAELKRWKTHIDDISNDKTLHTGVRERLSAFKESLKTTFAKSLDDRDPALAAKLRETDRKYANYKILEGVQTSAGADVNGAVSGPKLYNAVLKKYKGTKAAGDFGELADIGKAFFQKGPDSGTAVNTAAANKLLGLAQGGVGGVAATLASLPTTISALALYLGVTKALAAVYLKTPAYQRVLRAAKAVKAGGKDAASTGALALKALERSLKEGLTRPAAVNTAVSAVIDDAATGRE